MFGPVVTGEQEQRRSKKGVESGNRTSRSEGAMSKELIRKGCQDQGERVWEVEATKNIEVCEVMRLRKVNRISWSSESVAVPAMTLQHISARRDTPSDDWNTSRSYNSPLARCKVRQPFGLELCRASL